MSRRGYNQRLGLLLMFLSLMSSSPTLGQQVAGQQAPNPPVEDAAETSSKFLRVTRDDDGQPTALQTSIVRYAPADGKNQGLIVDLIGAVHVGDKSYFETLNKTFPSYDALLYELVAAEGANAPKPGQPRGTNNPVSFMQKGLKSLLELEFQLDHIDYSQDNFVHADMSPEEFSKSMRERNESPLKILLRLIANAPAPAADGPASPTDADLFAALFAQDRALRLKRIFAQQFEDIDVMMAALEGPNGSTLITQRNKKALEVLAREIAGGKKKLGVFYGAGHLKDMEKRLLNEFGLKRVEQRWLTAWSLTDEPPTPDQVEEQADQVPQP